MKEDVLADRKRSFNLLCDETINQPLIPPENETKEQKESNSNKPECTFIKHDSSLSGQYSKELNPEMMHSTL